MNTVIEKLLSLDTPQERKIIAQGADIIRRGGLVVFPTETVYGLGADATNPWAAKHIYEAKGRPSDNPLIIHIAHPHEAALYAVTSPTYDMLTAAFMPGPLTVIMPVRPIIPSEVTAGLPTVAVRCPEHPVARALIAAAGVPIAAPSANLSGRPSPTCAAHVIEDMQGRVDMILDGGASEIGLESTIVKIEEDGGLLLLRPGGITPADLASVGCRVRIASAVTDALKAGETVISPGMKYRHYAPQAPLFLLDGTIEARIDFLAKRFKALQAEGKTLTVLTYNEEAVLLQRALPEISLLLMGNCDNEHAQAHALFDLLRQTDSLNTHELYAPLPRCEGMGLALYNRMIRAAAHQIIRL